MNAQLNKSKPVYFPTELWNEIKSYIPAPEPPFVRCIKAFNEWAETVLPQLPKPVVAQRLREWTFPNDPLRKYSPQFNEMTDPREKLYKRTTKDSLSTHLVFQMRRNIGVAFAEYSEEGLYTFDGDLINTAKNEEYFKTNGYYYSGYNPKTNIDPAIIIAYREIYKRLKKEIKLYRQSNL